MAQRKPVPTANDDHEEIPLDKVTATFVPKTELGRRLLALRKEIVRSGIPMLSNDDLDREIAERRGGVQLRDYETLHGARLTFELWNTSTQTLIAAYDTEADALAAVSAAIHTHGPSYSDSLALVHDDPNTIPHTLAIGPDLAHRAGTPISDHPPRQ